MEPSSDSDSDSDITYMLDLDISGNTNDDKPNSPKNMQDEEEKQMITRPVLSVQCLHEDTEEMSYNSRNVASSSRYININEVPVLSLISTENDKPQDSNHEIEVDSETEEHPYLEPTNSKTSTVICIPVQLKTVRQVIPPRSNFKGIHNFMVQIDFNAQPKKSESPAYSESRNKLYVCKDNPFRILVSAENVPIGSILRVHAVYSWPEHSSIPVVRCPTHAQQDFAKRHPAYEHFVQCVSDTAVYEKNPASGQMSVSIPYEKPQDGETFTTYLLKLTCFSSCSGGINRRPFTLVFTLEKDQVPLGRQVIEAKVCACPMRDFKCDNEKEKKRLRHNDSEENSIAEDDETLDLSYDTRLHGTQIEIEVFPRPRKYKCPNYKQLIEKKKAKSIVWTYFGLPADENGQVIVDNLAICKTCRVSVSCKDGCTSNLMSHLKHYHPSPNLQINPVNRQHIPVTSTSNSENIDDDPSIVLPTSNSNYPTQFGNMPLAKKQKIMHDFQPLDSDLSKKCTDSITKFLVGTMQPLNVVESKFFITMVNTLNPRYKVPSRKFFSKTAVPKLYNDVTETIKRELASVDGNNICLTTDCWTSLANTPYIAVTAHFIDAEWNLKSVCLCCTQFEENHTSENITHLMKDILSDWNIDAQKITSCTTDNGPNIVKAISMLDVPHMPCFGHTINIGINKALQIPVLKRALSRLNELQNTIAHSFKMARDLTKAQELMQMDVVSLPSACITRWWSILKLCRRFLRNQLPICNLLQDYPEKKHLNIENKEIVALEELITATAVFENVTTNLSGEEYTTASSILPLLQKIKKSLQVSETNSTLLQEIKTEIYSVLQCLYETDNLMSLLRLCSFCDPRFKLNFVDDPNKTKSIALTKMTEMYNEVNYNTSSTQTNTEKPKRGLAKLLENEDDDTDDNGCVLPSKKAETELNHYLCMPKVGLNENPLLWWKLNEHTFPTLKVLAKKYLAVQGTSVPSERVFTTRGHIINKRRASLLPKNAELLVFLSQNKNYI